MISTMTFDDLVGHYENYLAAVEPEAAHEAAQARREITTTVLWLTELYGLDIRCVRLTPYRVGERVLLDMQQVTVAATSADRKSRPNRLPARTLHRISAGSLILADTK